MIFDLTDLEKQVLFKLAMNGPLSGYDFHLGGKKRRGKREALMSSGSWEKIRKNLGIDGKGLIQIVSYSEAGRGRRKNLYWLTLDGVFKSILFDAPPMIVFTHAEEVYKKALNTPSLKESLDIIDWKKEELSQWMDYFRALAKRMGDNRFKNFISGCIATGEGVFRLNDFPIDPQDSKDCVDIAHHYPIVRKFLKPTMRKIVKDITELYEDLGKKL